MKSAGSLLLVEFIDPLICQRIEMFCELRISATNLLVSVELFEALTNAVERFLPSFSDQPFVRSWRLRFLRLVFLWCELSLLKFHCANVWGTDCLLQLRRKAPFEFL